MWENSTGAWFSNNYGPWWNLKKLCYSLKCALWKTSVGAWFSNNWMKFWWNSIAAPWCKMKMNSYLNLFSFSDKSWQKLSVNLLKWFNLISVNHFFQNNFQHACARSFYRDRRLLHSNVYWQIVHGLSHTSQWQIWYIILVGTKLQWYS